MAAALEHRTAVLVLGASNAAGQAFIERASRHDELHLLAVSRRPPASAQAGMTWLQHDLNDGPVSAMASVLVSFGPLALALRQLEATPSLGRVIALSSASTLFKADSDDPSERTQMAAIRNDEALLQALCEARGAALTLLKTTMIYGGGNDANVSRLAGLTARLPFVPVVGNGLRQPVHAHDLAELALRMLSRNAGSTGTWLLGGGETLTYAAMLRRIGAAQGRAVRVLRLPLPTLRLVLRMAHVLSLLRDVRPVMLERQAVDLVVDDRPARERLGWNPRGFSP